MAQPDDDWAGRLARTIATEVRRYRQERKMSAQQLADRCADIGMPIQRSVLANLENGRRGTVSVAETLVLARALDVPPALLLFPIGRAETMEVLPGQSLPPWDAFMWFAGERELTTWRIAPGGPDALLVTLGPTDHGQVKMFRDHDLYRRTWNRAWAALQNATKAARSARTGEESQAHRAIAENMTDQLNSAEDDLRMIRRLMRESGLVPPPLPDELSQVDDTQWSRTVTATAARPLQVWAAADILGMGRPVLLDLTRMRPAWRAQVEKLVSALMDELHGTAEHLPDTGTFRLTPGDTDWDDARAALARFTAALETAEDGS